MMVPPTKEWGELPSPGLILCQTSTKEIPKTEHINKSARKGNAIIMHSGDSILAAAAEARIDENWRLLDNQLICNALITEKYLSNIIDPPDEKYLHFH